MDNLPISYKQSGMALMVSLIFLVLLTLLAVSAMHGTILQERMAGNTRDRMLAFQAAEAALRVAENTLGNSGLPSGTGVYMVPGTSPAATFTFTQQWDPAYSGTHYDWANNAATLASGSVGTNVAFQPQYVIERLTITPPAACSSSGGSTSFPIPPGKGFFRITSRGVGATTNASVILQEIYVRC